MRKYFYFNQLLLIVWCLCGLAFSATAQIIATEDAIPQDANVIAEIANAPQEENDADAVEDVARTYQLGVNAKCGKRSSDELVFCVDNDNHPITGSVIKLNNGLIYRLYAVKEGLLDGVSEVYDAFGNLIETRPYANGNLEGELKQYESDGKIAAVISYSKGKKEGVSTFYNGVSVTKTAFSDDVAVGDTATYDMEQGKALYRFKTEENRFISGSYTYARCDEAQSKDGECVLVYDTVEIPSVILTGLNKGCIKMYEKMNMSSCVAEESGLSLAECDKEWFINNINALKEYFNQCREETQKAIKK